MTEPIGPAGFLARRVLRTAGAGVSPTVVETAALTDPALRAARQAIAAKAAALGPGFTGAAERPTHAAASPTGEPSYLQRYARCTIYYHPRTGAHEVHGAIRAKYDQLDGLRRFGRR
jgi:hypothetical protein